MPLKKGDDVQMTRLGIKRQRPSMMKRTEGSVGIFRRYSTCGRFCFVDWYCSEPWDHLQLMKHNVAYIEPLGTPR